MNPREGGSSQPEQGKQGKAELRRPELGVKKPPPQTKNTPQDAQDQPFALQIYRFGRFPPSAIRHLILEAVVMTSGREKAGRSAP